MINITLTSDFICPWCRIGEQRLEKAISLLPADLDVTIDWRPFELNPDMPEAGMDRRTYRSEKFGSWEKSQALDRQTEIAAASEGVTFDYALMEKTPNTHKAHRLMWWAGTPDLRAQLGPAILEAYFLQGQDIGRTDVLARLAGGLGLDVETAARFLDSDQGSAEVRTLESEAARRGIQGVPTFEINGITVSGAQRAELLRDAILRAANGAAA